MGKLTEEKREDLAWGD